MQDTGDEHRDGGARRRAATSVPMRITIVGGGFTGASCALQLGRASRRALAITIIEARAELGGGLAHSADDPDHRLNGPANMHYVDPSDSEAFQRWWTERDLVKTDPGACVADGTLYPRRKDFGRFVAETLRQHETLPTGSSISHVQDVAQDIAPAGSGFTVCTRGGLAIAADMVIVATGNALPRLPTEFDAIAPSHPGIIAVPTDLARVRAIPNSARVLVLGTGLTALDILSSLLRSGHAGQITAVSRRGLRPAPQRPAGSLASDAPVLHWPSRIDGPLPHFLAEVARAPTVRNMVRALRARIRQAEAAGDLWYTPYDELRDGLWQLWPSFPLHEKRRFLQRLRPWYDNFRFRSPPQSEAMVRQAEAAGRVCFRASRIRAVSCDPDEVLRVAMRDRGSLRERVETFDAVINCTGVDTVAGVRDNPFLSSLMHRGLISVDPTGVGLAVDQDCRAIAADGRVRDALRIVGPPTSGAFADQVGAAFIAARIQRSLADWLRAVEALHGQALQLQASCGGGIVHAAS